MYRLVVVHTLKLGLLVALLVFALSACGGGGAGGGGGGEQAEQKEQAEANSIPKPPRAGGTFPPGRYVTKEFEPTLSFSLGKGWGGSVPETHDLLTISREDPATQAFGILGFEIPAWLPSEHARKAYLILQRQAHGGREPRRPKERNVALFVFVLEKARVKPVSRSEYLARLEILEKKEVTWSKLMGDWNRLYEPGHPWHYREVSNFRRDFGRGQQAVAGTMYALSGIPGEPKTAADSEAHYERMLERFRRSGAAFVEATDEEIS